MAELQSQILNNVMLTTRVSNTEQIVQFVEDSIREMAGGMPDMSKLDLTYRSTEEEKKIALSYDGRELGSIDASDFVKDGMISDVSYDEGTHVLTIIWNSDGGGKTTEINLSGLVSTYTAGEGLTLENGEFSLTAYIPDKMSDLSDDVGYLTEETDPVFQSLSGQFLTEHQSLDDYYQKSETSSAAEVETALAGKQPSGDYATSAYVDGSCRNLSGNLTGWVEGQNYVTEHQSLSDYYAKSETSSAAEISVALDGKQSSGDYATSAYVNDQIQLSVHHYNAGDGIVIEPYFNPLEMLGPASQTIHRVKIDEDYTATKSYVRNTVDDVVISALSDVAQYESYEQVPLSAIVKSLWQLSRQSAWPEEE